MSSVKSNAFAFFPIGPINDYLRMAKEQLKTMDTQIIFSEKMEQAYAALEEMGVLGAQEVDSKNAAIGNQNVRDARRVQEISRLEQMQKSVPAFMPCGTVTNNILMKHVNNNKKAYLKNQEEAMSQISNVAQSGNQDAADGKVFYSELIAEKIKKSQENNLSNSSNKNSANTEGKEDLFIANSSMIFSSNEKYDTLSKEQKEAMEGFVLLVAPPYQAKKSDIRDEVQIPEMRIKRISNEIRHNMVNQVFNRLLAKKIALGETYPSEMTIMRENSKNVYFNPEKPKETIAYKIQTSQIATPSAVMRTHAVLLANRISYSIKEYQESLYQERIMAQLLLEKINK